MMAHPENNLFRSASLLFVALLGSCTADPEPDRYVPLPGETENMMTFRINIPRSTLPQTRAIADGGLAEDVIDEITLLLFDTDGSYDTTVEATSITTDPDDSNSKTFTAIIPDGEFTMLVLANADGMLDAFMSANPDPAGKTIDFFEQNLSDKLIEDNGTGGFTPWNADPDSGDFKPFPMAGRFVIPADRSEAMGSIFLTRMLAKINIGLAIDYPLDADRSAIYRLDGVMIPNFNTIGNLIPREPVQGEALSVFDPAQLNIPSAPGPVSGVEDALVFPGEEIAASGGTTFSYGCIDEIFLPEMAGSANAQSGACILVEIFIPSIDRQRWFRVDLSMTNSAVGNVEPVNIRRNFRYSVSITNVSGQGYATPGEAFDAPSDGVEIEISAIDGSDMNDITFDNHNQLTVNKSDFLFYDDGVGQELKIFTDYFGGWEVANIDGVWISTSESEGQAGQTFPATIVCEPYTGSTVRTGSILITAGLLRKTIDIVQLPPADNIVDNVAPEGFMSYVGAFWKASQTGERLIRIGHAADIAESDGAWLAAVIEGREWVDLDTRMTADPNVGWRTDTTPVEADVDNGNDAGFDGKYQIAGDLDYVEGTLDAEDPVIYFRVGLNGPHRVTAEKPVRYGAILLAYNNYTKLQRIWLRQGEGADYLFRKDDPVGGEIDQRTAAVPISPYNLTAATLNAQAGLNGQGPNPGIFTDYPSQVGAYWQWASADNPRYAWDPYSFDAMQGWSYESENDVWSNLRMEHETCPEGYRRPSDGSTEVETGINYTTGALLESEIRQSLFAVPTSSNWWPFTYNSNYVRGYYADGFFDRRAVTWDGTLIDGVSKGNRDIANTGGLFYNQSSGASLFIPKTGRREGDIILFAAEAPYGLLVNPGVDDEYYWTSTAQHDGAAWSFVGYPSMSSGLAIRCVADSDHIPSGR